MINQFLTLLAQTATGYFKHAFLILTFRHSGANLPKTLKSFAGMVLFLPYVTSFWWRHHEEPSRAVSSIAQAVLLYCLLHAMFGRRIGAVFQVVMTVSIILCMTTPIGKAVAFEGTQQSLFPAILSIVYIGYYALLDFLSKKR